MTPTRLQKIKLLSLLWFMLGMCIALQAQPNFLPSIRIHPSQKIVDIYLLTPLVKDTLHFEYKKTKQVPTLLLPKSILLGKLPLNTSQSYALPQDSTQSHFSGFIRGGVGNYGASLAEVFLQLEHAFAQSISLHILHRGWQRGAVANNYSAFTQQAFVAQGLNSWANKHYLYSEGGYKQMRSFLYGKPNLTNQNRESVRQLFEHFFAKALWLIPNKEISTTLYAHQYFQRQAQTSTENQALANIKLGNIANFPKIIPTEARTRLKAEAQVWYSQLDQKPQNTFRQQRLVATFSPYLYVAKPKHTTQLGLALFYIGDNFSAPATDNTPAQQERTNDFRLFLNVTNHWKLNKGWHLRSQLMAQTQNHSLQSLSQENVFIAQNQVLRTSYERLLGASIQKQWHNRLSIEAEVQMYNIRDMAFFANLPTETGEIGTLFYDINYIHFKVEAQQHWGRAWQWKLKMIQRSFSTINLHHPTQIYEGYVQYQPKKAWYIRMQSYVWAGMQKAIYNNDPLPTLRGSRLAPIFDLNLETNYCFFEKFYTSLLLNNLLNQNYQRFYNYPVQGFNFLISLKYAF